MKKILMSALALTAAAALLAGCTASAAQEPSETVVAAATTASSSKAASSASASSHAVPSASSSAMSGSSDMEMDATQRVLSTLMENEYSELAITAKVKEAEVKPGEAVKVEITVTNEGDKTLVYRRGSHMLENPDSLLMEVKDLQPVMSKDQLEALDDSSKQDEGAHKLEPGDKETFEMHVMAIEPNSEFEERTHTVFATGTFIGDLQWDELHDRYPDLVKAAVGDYAGHAYFTYYVLKDGEMESATQTPTGYGLADFTIKVAE